MDKTIRNWIFLRGWMRESAHWGEFPKRFEYRIANTKVHLIDIPGNGKYWKQKTPLHISEITEQVRKNSGGLAETRPFILAMSLGALVATHWVHCYPKQCSGIVLINASFRGFNRFYHRLRPRALPKLISIALDRDIISREKKIIKLTSQSVIPNSSLLKSRLVAYQKHPVKRSNSIRQLIAAAQYAGPKDAPKVPVLLLNSLGDKLVNPKCSGIIAKTWNCLIETHPSAGHDIVLEDPNWVIEKVFAHFIPQK